VISLGDVAIGMIAAAEAGTAGGARLMRLRLVIPMLAQDVPEGAALWATVLRVPTARRVPPASIAGWWLARWRRRGRRRDGWQPIAVELHWTRTGVIACTDGRRIARYPVFAPVSANKGPSS